MIQTLGDRIASARATVSMSQREFGRRVAVSHVSIKNWETGATEPAARSLIRIAKVSGLSLRWLESGQGNPNEPDPVATPQATPEATPEATPSETPDARRKSLQKGVPKRKWSGGEDELLGKAGNAHVAVATGRTLKAVSCRRRFLARATVDATRPEIEATPEATHQAEPVAAVRVWFVRTDGGLVGFAGLDQIVVGTDVHLGGRRYAVIGLAGRLGGPLTARVSGPL